MGCAASSQGSQKNKITSPSMKSPTAGSSWQSDKSKPSKARFYEAIKRRDAILFEKGLVNCNTKPSELINNYDSKRTMLHHIAEENFSEGMNLIINYILQKEPNRASQIANTIDVGGNSPAMHCCKFKAYQTLEVLVKHDLVDMNARNMEGKNIVEVASENSQGLVNLLTMASTSQIKSSMRQTSTDAPTSLDSARLRKQANNDDDATTPLTSVLTLTKDKLGKESQTTKAYGLLKKLRGSETTYIDEEFPHDMYSIAEGPSSENYPPMKWLRPHQFLNCDPKKVTIFETVDLADTSRSALFGCDLYSALTMMMEFPQRLLNTFVLKEVNKYGVYSVRFLVAGQPIEIILDDYFPCFEDTGNLVFSKPVNKEIWFLLIEKALAKLFGNYALLRSITLSEAMELITSMPTSEHPVQEGMEEEIWDMLLSYEKNQYIMSASRKIRDGENTVQTTGNLTCPIVSVHEVKGVKIIKLRNYNKGFEWNGMLSERSKHWSKDLQEEVGFTKGEKNVVYLELSEFLSHFELLTACHYRDGWTRSMLNVTSTPKESVFFEITVQEEMDVYLSVHQKQASFLEDCQDYAISPVEMLLAEKLADNNFKKIAHGEVDAFVGKSTTYVDSEASLTLEPGTYVIRLKVRWLDKKDHEFSFNTFSPVHLPVRQVDSERYHDFLERVYIGLGSRIKEKYQLSNQCEFISKWCGPHMWIYAVNRGQKVWTMNMDFTKLENLKLCKKYRKEKNSQELQVLPGQERAIYCKRKTADIVEMLWKLSHKWE